MSPDEIVLFCDAMRIKVCPRMFPEWPLPGMRHQVEATCLEEGSRTLYGAVNIATGELTYKIFKRGRSIEFIQLMDTILTDNPNKTVKVVVDNHIVHRSRETRRYLAHHPNLHLVFIPT